MFALYDIDGILRFSCNDREACEAYAELLDLPKNEYSLMDLPETNFLELKPSHSKRSRHPRVRSSN